ncbi:hypothetical protein QZH41_011721 [Actinostola sp. cb2023]|nr:hypothetical protein QZH41_011721 [Actinostola sp. cb2023]
MMRVPDWIYLLIKLKSRISDVSWQNFTSLTKLGRTGKKCDEAIILVKSNIVALRQRSFGVTRQLMELKALDSEIPGFEVSLESAIMWSVREMRLHGHCPKELIFNIKVDGRPFCGKDQVTIGIVALNTPFKSSQSAKSVQTLAIANCKENRADLRKLVHNLNIQKAVLKKNGLTVDGKIYAISFKVTLDYKGLVLIFMKHDDEDFQLGGRGLDVEFCLFCLAKRACSCDLGKHEVCLEHFAQTKANIGGWKGLRDDLTCILDEDLSSVSLCALHCEMRNTEQLLKNVGLMAYQIGSLEECNSKLSNYGPQNIKADRINVKTRPGQQTAISRHNISVCSFSGNTERQILNAVEEIIDVSLPADKMAAHFQDQEAAIRCVTNKIVFCEDRIKYYDEMIGSGIYIRDFGTRLEEITLTNSAAKEEMEKTLTFWREMKDEIERQFKNVYKPRARMSRRKTLVHESDVNTELSCYAGTLTKEFMVQASVCTQWREIALTMRDKVFNEDEECLIDVFDLKCKEWGFLLLEMFGSSLGTGDYGHLTVDHASTLFRMHRSFYELSNQGFEAAHKLQRQLYLKATSHDATGYTSSCEYMEQILLHLYTEGLLELRLSFTEAKHCIESGNRFYYRGCGWGPKKVNWGIEDIAWIDAMLARFKDLFGPDFCRYKYKENKACVVEVGESDNNDKTSHDNVDTDDDETSHDNDDTDDDKTSHDNIDTDDDETSHDTDDDETSHDNDDTDDDKTSHDNIDTDDDKTSHDTDDDKTSHDNIDTDDDKTSHDNNDTDDDEKSHDNDETSPHPNQRQASADLQRCFYANLTRREQADMNLPQVMHISSTDIKLVNGASSESSLLHIKFRPSASTIKHAMDLISRSKKSTTCPSTENKCVMVGCCGVYSKESLRLLTKLCSVAEVCMAVRQEEDWLSMFNQQQTSGIRDILYNCRADDEVMRDGLCIMDTHDFSTIACERYVNGFAIDTVCLETLKVSQSTSVVYLPTFCQTWAKQGVQFFRHRVSRLCPSTNLGTAKLILTPVHDKNKQHWGLLCFNIQSKVVYYDDGLKKCPPSGTLQVIKNMLGGFEALTSKADFKNNWNNENLTLPLPRVNMPVQPKSGEGSASCGIGVILTTRDIIESNDDHPIFKWRYETMNTHRVELMAQIVRWKKGG